MAAWERFLTGDPAAAIPARNFVVASWLRSQELGINPTGRSAPLVARGDAIEGLRRHHADLVSAAAQVFAEVAEMFSGSRSIMLLTNNDGVVLDAVGDRHTLEQGESIHLTRGGDWREDAVGTNGIGTALATGRPAQVHAAEHFCEGIKAWTCAAAPIFEPGTGAMLGVVDISGPPSTYGRNNLSLAVSAARQVEMVLAERVAAERMRLLEVCLDRISEADVAGMVAIDRAGRLVHRTGRVPTLVGLGQRVPGLDDGSMVEDWADRLPEGLRAEWFSPVRVEGRAIGAVLVVPARTRAATPEQPGAFDAILGRSPAMADAVGRARQLVGKQVPVLIEGETGVGKELFARAIHFAHDPRRPFIAFNCGAVARDLLAAELFGHVRGAFTGAASEGRAGRFELAHGGTLCLDEIGELPLDLQPFLLRALEEGVIYRLGDGQPRRVEVRLLAMTNRTLLEEVAAGRFRRDLYHRIGVTRIRPPPLRERHGDLELLVEHFNAIARRAPRGAAAPLRPGGAAPARRLSLARQRAGVAQRRRKPAADVGHAGCPAGRAGRRVVVGADRPAARSVRSAGEPGSVGTRGDHRRGAAVLGQPDRGGEVAGRVAQHALPENRAVPAANLSRRSRRRDRRRAVPRAGPARRGPDPRRPRRPSVACRLPRHGGTAHQRLAAGGGAS